ncbi:MAG: selenocysteine-specific translation elongation factor [Dehalococcoidia bacterium]|nr:MAG: selenocysteine-specific translation elongation factor [Dehalococcoidia bacterium]
MFVLGTAGHVDHGKSVLVHALTGIDPDRLMEEKERGMTIDLGFAWLTLPSGQEVGIVDVPGHEHFIKNMLAGVGGIDLALLIVAANEGVMPQTREHLDILNLIGVNRGIVVITKKDLVDEELLTLVTMEIEELLVSTTLAEAPIVAVSAQSGEGIPELVSAIDQLLETTPPRADTGRPRLLIDRVFTIAGSGTVVTGTLVDGSLQTGQQVEILPSGLRSRLRGLQTHKTRLDTATPGSRVAANLTGIAVSQMARGDVLTRPGWLSPTTMATVKLHLLPSLKRPLRYNATVSFHTGASETMAKVRLLDKDELKPGENDWAQLILTGPVAVVKGDHFIIRSPQETLGGGEIIEPRTKRYRRHRTATIQSLETKEKGTDQEILTATLEANQPLEVEKLIHSSSIPVKEAKPAIDGLIQDGVLVAIGAGEHRVLYTASGWEHLVESATAAVKDYHQRFPTRPGMPRGELGNKLKLPSAASTNVMHRLFDTGTLVEEGPNIRLSSHQIQLTKDQQIKTDAFLNTLAQNPFAPPSDMAIDTELLSVLIKQHKVVRVSDSVVFAASAYDEMVKRIVAHIRANGKITLAETRDLFNTSRKYAQALLEHLDQEKITRRVGDERVLGSSSP